MAEQRERKKRPRGRPRKGTKWDPDLQQYVPGTPVPYTDKERRARNAQYARISRKRRREKITAQLQQLKTIEQQLQELAPTAEKQQSQQQSPPEYQTRLEQTLEQQTDYINSMREYVDRLERENRTLKALLCAATGNKASPFLRMDAVANVAVLPPVGLPISPNDFR